jgi:threonine/homoserine/homoserine lactone efflux protein
MERNSMTLQTYTAFVLFVIVMTGTPGIGNLTMMAIGQNTGFRSALPFLAGTTVGAISLNSMVALGLGGIFIASPLIAWIMKIIGMIYIFYLGWKILSIQIGTTKADKRFSFTEGLFVHPTNPKSWAMAVVGFSQIARPNAPLIEQMMIFVLTFAFFQVSFHSLWGWAGAMIMQTLTSRKSLLALNSVLVAVMIGATLYAMLLSPA